MSRRRLRAVPSTDEVVGRLLRQISEAAGPGASVHTASHDNWHEVNVQKLDIFRYQLHNADDIDAPVRIWDTRNGMRVLTVRRATLLKALQDAGAALAFPAASGATLRVIDGGAR